MKESTGSATSGVSRVWNGRFRMTALPGYNPNALCAIGAGRLRSMTVSGSTRAVSGLAVNHIDGNRDNNRADNLEMCTHQRNMEHAIAGGLKRDYGEKSVNAKLTNGQAEEIRVRYSSGQASQNSLAKQYGVSRQTVSAIIRYKKYIR